MASILVLAKDLLSAGRVEGDPVSVKADSDTYTDAFGTWHWSLEEDSAHWVAAGRNLADFPDLFYVVNIPGLQKGRALRMMQNHMRPATIADPEFFASDEADRIVKVAQHRWQLHLGRMSPNDEAELRRERTITLANNTNALNNLIRDSSAKDSWVNDAPVDPRPTPRG